MPGKPSRRMRNTAYKGGGIPSQNEGWRDQRGAGDSPNGSDPEGSPYLFPTLLALPAELQSPGPSTVRCRARGGSGDGASWLRTHCGDPVRLPPLLPWPPPARVRELAQQNTLAPASCCATESWVSPAGRKGAAAGPRFRSPEGGGRRGARPERDPGGAAAPPAAPGPHRASVLLLLEYTFASCPPTPHGEGATREARNDLSQSFSLQVPNESSIGWQIRQGQVFQTLG